MPAAAGEFAPKEVFYADRHPPGARVAFTRADVLGHTPRSEGTGFGGLNLGLHVGDDPQAVQRNRARVAAAWGVLPAQLVFMNQVHGCAIAEVTTARPPTHPVDGLVTRRRDVVLAVLVADCVPVVLADPDAGVLGVAHAGRAGMTAGIATALVAAMRDLGARHISGYLGPSICGRCYPVPAELRASVAGHWPVTQSVSWSGEPSLDIAAGVLAQLAAAEVQVEQIKGCTAESEELFSYRRAARTGRFAGLAQLVGSATEPEPRLGTRDVG